MDAGDGNMKLTHVNDDLMKKQAWLSPVKPQGCPLGTSTLFLWATSFLLAGTLLFSLFYFIESRGSSRQWETTRDRAKPEQWNPKAKRLLILHRETSSVTKEMFIQTAAPAEALLHLNKKNGSKALFSMTGTHKAKGEATIWWSQVAVVQRRDRYRELMGLRCYPLACQAAPHLPPRPDQQRSLALLTTHIHLSISSFSHFHTFCGPLFQHFCLQYVSKP